MAAGPAEAKAEIYDVPSANIGRASFVRPSVEHRIAGAVEVRPLDEILASVTVDFLKIDVEGFEADVLKGASETLRKQPVICMEVSAGLDGDHLAAHDIIMATGLYRPFRLSGGKEIASEQVEVRRDQLLVQSDDNVFYLPTQHAGTPSSEA